MIEVVLLVVAGYFALWVYAYILVIKFQKSLYRRFPDNANQILGTKTVLGINAKTGLLFLWREDTKELARRDETTNALRRTTVRTMYLLFIALFLFIPFILIIWVVFFRI